MEKLGSNNGEGKREEGEEKSPTIGEENGSPIQKTGDTDRDGEKNQESIRSKEGETRNHEKINEKDKQERKEEEQGEEHGGGIGKRDDDFDSPDTQALC